MIFISCISYAQEKKGPVAKFTFNHSVTTDEVAQLKAKIIGTSWSKDRFGNDKCAINVDGAEGSYINLGTSSILKPYSGSISLWVNIGMAIQSGKGYKMNPILLTKSDTSSNFFEAYAIYYDFSRNKLATGMTYDSVRQSGITVSDIEFNKWYHLVLSYDDDYMEFYVNGALKNRLKKGFRSKFQAEDSVIIGTSADKINLRFFNGSVDDIVFYDRMISQEEILALYNEPNPNYWADILEKVFLFLLILGGIILILFGIINRYKTSLRRQNEMFELEIKAMKAQMNPHFIFNSLNSIQQFVLENDSKNAYSYLSKFSVLVRKILESNTAKSISVRDELKILEGYLEMESLRFSNVFEYKITMDERLTGEGFQVPHMMVQPFIENAIWHGLLHKEGDKRLSLEFGYLDEKRIRCKIDDNGVGRLHYKKHDPMSKKKSLAMDLIKQRLENYHKVLKVECGIDIVDKTDATGNSEGTLVEITIPLIK